MPPDGIRGPLWFCSFPLLRSLPLNNSLCVCPLPFLFPFRLSLSSAPLLIPFYFIPPFELYHCIFCLTYTFILLSLFTRVTGYAYSTTREDERPHTQDGSERPGPTVIGDTQDGSTIYIGGIERPNPRHMSEEISLIQQLRDLILKKESFPSFFCYHTTKGNGSSCKNDAYISFSISHQDLGATHNIA